jgi:hypothetical protein
MPSEVCGAVGAAPVPGMMTLATWRGGIVHKAIRWIGSVLATAHRYREDAIGTEDSDHVPDDRTAVEQEPDERDEPRNPEVRQRGNLV